MKKFFLLLTVFVLFGVAACKKDKSPTDLLTGTDWQMKGWTVTPPIFGITDYYANAEACEKDDFLRFNKNGTVVFDEGATKCDAADPQTETSSWAFNSNETEITFDLNDDPTTFKIKELTEDTFKLETSFEDDIDEDGVNETFTFTLTFEAK